MKLEQFYVVALAFAAVLFALAGLASAVANFAAPGRIKTAASYAAPRLLKAYQIARGMIPDPGAKQDASKAAGSDQVKP